MRPLADDEYLDYAAFYQCLHCLLRQNRSSEKEMHFLENVFRDPSIDLIGHSKLIV